MPATLTAAATFLVALATLVKAYKNGAKTDAVHADVQTVKENTVPTAPTDPGK